MDLAVLATRLEAAAAAQRRAQADLDLAEIRAPMDGQIIELNTYPGEAIGPGGLLDMGETADMMVEAEVDVLDLGRVRKGGPVRITGEGLAAEATGRVEEIFLKVTANALVDPEPLANADLRVVRVRIRPDRPRDLEGLVNALVSVRFLP